ncbi:sensor histidine kinase [Vagococcus sp. DIV0080]|uniref:histidine kinase n=1 Tax=Candidatus Vagococcus giribetii TaxID=2230876 RepID=A0ABS3HSL5_9ENTE|nr:sensor histidine kinase [Vagococcus sp. DIV0080]MBO0476753.1 sensor histidine kinase [Vagococcus sp. DIV0080]
MKEFLKNQSLYLISLITSISLVVGIMWLDGYRDTKLLIYACLLTLLSVVLFLGITYLRQKKLYQLMESKEVRVNFEQVQEDSSNLSRNVYELLNKEHLYYYQVIQEQKYALEEHQHFMYQWVHQMKTPLAVIELMVDGGELDKHSLLEETDRMKEGLNLALNMARIDSFNQDFMIEQVNLKQLVTQVINEQKRNLIRHQVFPKLEIDEQIVIETDRKWLAFCLTQLLLNSIKYTKKNESRLMITSRMTKNTCELSLKDYGIGIEKKDLPRIFNPFFTGNTGRNQREATGMGLYLVKKVLSRLDHGITVASEKDVGTTMTITFNEMGRKK